LVQIIAHYLPVVLVEGDANAVLIPLPPLLRQTEVIREYEWNPRLFDLFKRTVILMTVTSRWQANDAFDFTPSHAQPNPMIRTHLTGASNCTPRHKTDHQYQ